MVDLNRHTSGIPPATPGNEPPVSPATTGSGNPVEPHPTVAFGPNNTGGFTQQNLGNLPVTPLSPKDQAKMRHNYLKSVSSADGSSLFQQYVQGNLTPTAIRENIIRNSPNAPGLFGMAAPEIQGKTAPNSGNADDSIAQLFDQLIPDNTHQYLTSFAGIMKRAVGSLLSSARQAALQQALVVSDQRQAVGQSQQYPE